MSEEKNQRLKEYQKNYHVQKRSQYNNEENSFFNYDLKVYSVTFSYTHISLGTFLL